ncbi:transposase DDE domain protein [Leptospira weilii str. 2006001855]|uniref:Transposase DDE domain protein n=2 Tax=Leptospira weilii TaxID=28184 RepID=M6QAH9_9LEPT|nr:transposase DDE domain protein [Leptospira weilii str. 2006001855]EMN92319.1 transposase DDE domain protein [Leptospira weilii str. UI 13098]
MKPPGNVDDRNSKVIFPLSKNIYGKLFGDKGYISQSLFVSA